MSKQITAARVVGHYLGQAGLSLQCIYIGELDNFVKKWLKDVVGGLVIRIQGIQIECRMCPLFLFQNQNHILMPAWDGLKPVEDPMTS